jgi:hypothetical protein
MTIALLTACSQQLASSTPNLKSSAPETTATEHSTLTSVREKPLLSQGTAQSASGSETELSSCRAADLKAVLEEMQGAVGTRYGIIKFTNSTDTACVLQGRPQIELLDSRQQRLSVRKDAIQSANVDSKVTLQPGQQANLRFRWSNWCQKVPNNEIKFVVTLPDNQEQVPVVLPDAPEYHDAPPCNGPGSPSVLSVDVFKSPIKSP